MWAPPLDYGAHIPFLDKDSLILAQRQNPSPQRDGAADQKQSILAANERE